jgi:DNA mismatch repair protein MSH6
MEEELLSMQIFEKYEPLDYQHLSISSPCSSPKQPLPQFLSSQRKMILDSVTLANLDIFENSSTGTSEGTLLDIMDQCVTPFGMQIVI